MAGHKVGYCATGAVGVACWNIVGTMDRLAITYSCPFNFDFYSNWLSIGVYTNDDEAGAKLFSRMYYGKKLCHFERRKFRNKQSVISFEVGDYQIYATMGSSHAPEIKVWLFPKSMRNLAPNISV